MTRTLPDTTPRRAVQVPDETHNACGTAVRRCGAISLGRGTVLWRVWAPRAKAVELVLSEGERRRTVPMAAEPDGYFRHTADNIPDGRRYVYRLDGGPERQDPCSLWQPDGVPGPSAVVRTESFKWTDRAWMGVAREDLVVYELHVGTFTPQGTFEAIIPRLRELRELGVTAIELMPVNQFPGSRNWGYDGVLPYAAQNTYGGPHGLHNLVDAAHSAGVAVILDVVYNHLGPEANFVHEFGPYFTDKYKTPWGAAVNYDDRGADAVRDWVLDNVRMWLEEFHLDGLRLDAVHAIYDLGARHILRAIRELADDVSARTGRTIHVIAESDLNDPKVVMPPERGGYGLDAQWSDDFHHAVHALLTGERRGYYSDFGDADHLAKALRTPFVYAWDRSPHRGRKHGAPPPPDLAGDRFVVCIQNHDQVGNRAVGDRLGVLLGSPAKQRLAASLLLLAPHVPLLFMGEEYGETRPFPFFCSFCGEELIRAVREGRKKEFADFVSDPSEVPLPDAVETFESARLTWSWPEGSVHAGIRRLYADLLGARTGWPAMKDFTRRDARLHGNDAQSRGVLELVRGGSLRAWFNLADQPAPLPGGDAILFASEAWRYGGERNDIDIRELIPHECVVTGPRTWPRLT
jgi:maltooligosyltrehalose trehalohydrolase